MRNGFGFNTNLIETNILNLRVVVRIVISQVGEFLKIRLNDRRKMILSILQEADTKNAQLQQQLEEARKALDEAQLTVQEIQNQSVQAVEQENLIIQKKLEEELKRFQENSKKLIKLERQRTIESITKYITELALTVAEEKIQKALQSKEKKKKELNRIHVQETFQKLKR